MLRLRYDVETSAATSPRAGPFLYGGSVSTTTSTSIIAGANSTSELEEHEVEHEHNALSTLWLNLTVIGCLMLAYFVKKFRIYWFPESAGALLVGVIVGGIARLATDQTQLFEFSPEIFFFVLLPPIIFEAGYSLKKKDFVSNIGAICLYTIGGTIISCFVVGGLLFQAARVGLVRNVDTDNPMEALLFGALISSVDPVAILSIMGTADLQCNSLLYSLVFGESVLNDAIAISLFNVFASFYDKNLIAMTQHSSSTTTPAPSLSSSQIPFALLTFATVSLLSILVGVALGLLPSYVYRHTYLSDFPRLETSLLFSCCYLCYSVAEALGLSGIMALFFQGMVLAHYNSYNLSQTALLASEQIFATLATISETTVFLYMGMGVFTERFVRFDLRLAIVALCLCVVSRFLNIFPMSFVANFCRSKSNRITLPMQCVLWFAGLRGAIAFALAMNMPGPHRESYATTTLFICIFTTVVCGGMTDRVLTEFGMKQEREYNDRFTFIGNGSSGSRRGNHINASSSEEEEEDLVLRRITSNPRSDDSRIRPDYALRQRTHLYKGAKRLWKQFDDEILKVHFGGSTYANPTTALNGYSEVDDDRCTYELGDLSEQGDLQTENEHAFR